MGEAPMRSESCGHTWMLSRGESYCESVTSYSVYATNIGSGSGVPESITDDIDEIEGKERDIDALFSNPATRTIDMVASRLRRVKKFMTRPEREWLYRELIAVVSRELGPGDASEEGGA